MIKKYLPLYMVTLIVLALAFVYGCGSAATSGGSSTSHGTNSYSGTQSPGDVWNWTISAETFLGSNETTGMWVTGSWETLTSGFGKAIISSAGGPSAPSAGDLAYFLEFPNTMLIVKPINPDGNNKVMVCAASASSAPSTGSYLFVNIPQKNWDSADPAFGTVEATYSSPFWHFKTWNYLITGEPWGNNAGTDDYVYTNGTFTDESNSSDLTKIFMTPSNVFFGDSGPSNGGFAGAKYDPSIVINSTAVKNHTYKGVRFIYYPVNGTGETEPITCTASSDGIGLWANSYNNIETGTLMGGGVNITFESTSSKGFTYGYIEDIGSGQPEMIQCAASKIGTDQKYMLYGIGLDERDRSFNFIIVQTD
jgi:hypothetical protein